jgi:hypothetical protein
VILALIILWIIWCIPMLLYILWKRGDWYLFIIPPTVISIIALCISIFSEILSIIAIIIIHIYLIVSFLFRIKK